MDLFVSCNYESDTNFSDVRLTVDEPTDFDVVKLVVENLGLDENWRTYTDFYLLNKKINELNGSYRRNEGYEKSLKED